MTFGDALEQAKAGRQIRRDDCPAGDKLTCVYTKDLHPYLMMFEGDSEPIPFFIGNTDLFATDWRVIIDGVCRGENYRQ